MDDMGPWQEYKAHSDTTKDQGEGPYYNSPWSRFEPHYRLGIPWYTLLALLLIPLSTCMR